MRTVGVVSDTHGLLRPEALAALEGSDLIVHAGDVGEQEILSRLGEIAPTYAVFGNTDWGAVRASLPHTQLLDLAAPDPASADRPEPDRDPEPGVALPPVLAYAIHIKEEIDLDPASVGIRMVVFGHTHEPYVGEHGGVLWLNPGSAGPRRARLPVTVARVRIEAGREIEAEIVGIS